MRLWHKHMLVTLTLLTKKHEIIFHIKTPMQCYLGYPPPFPVLMTGTPLQPYITSKNKTYRV